MTSNVIERHYWHKPRMDVSTLLPGFDDGAYDDIIETVRRQGFFDAIGYDLVPARYNNGDFSAIDYSRWRVAYHRPTRAEKLQLEYEAAQYRKQRERERIAEKEWKAEEARRAAAAKAEAATKAFFEQREAQRREQAERDRRRIAEQRLMERRTVVVIPTTDDPAQALRVAETLRVVQEVERAFNLTPTQRLVRTRLRAFWEHKWAKERGG